MGFLSGLGKMIQGKPVFEAGDQQNLTLNTPQKVSSPKVVPKVCIIRTECKENNGQMELTVHIKNESQVEVHADNIRIFDKVMQLDRNINPGQTSDFIVYSGPIMHDDNRNKCELKYRKTDGDYFAMQHTVEYGFAQNAYVVNSIRPVGPVNDI